MNQFRQAEIEHFVQQMMGHAHRFFSERARKLGDDELLLWIWRGISKAESYGFVTCRDICLFLTLMFTFGCEFDMNDNENDNEMPGPSKSFEISSLLSPLL